MFEPGSKISRAVTAISAALAFAGSASGFSKEDVRAELAANSARSASAALNPGRQQPDPILNKSSTLNIKITDQDGKPIEGAKAMVVPLTSADSLNAYAKEIFDRLKPNIKLAISKGEGSLEVTVDGNFTSTKAEIDYHKSNPDTRIAEAVLIIRKDGPSQSVIYVKQLGPVLEGTSIDQGTVAMGKIQASAIVKTDDGRAVVGAKVAAYVVGGEELANLAFKVGNFVTDEKGNISFQIGGLTLPSDASFMFELDNNAPTYTVKGASNGEDQGAIYVSRLPPAGGISKFIVAPKIAEVTFLDLKGLSLPPDFKGSTITANLSMGNESDTLKEIVRIPVRDLAVPALIADIGKATQEGGVVELVAGKYRTWVKVKSEERKNREVDSKVFSVIHDGPVKWFLAGSIKLNLNSRSPGLDLTGATSFTMTAIETEPNAPKIINDNFIGGEVELENLAPGKYRISVEGCQNIDATIIIEAGKLTKGTLTVVKKKD